MAIEVSVVGFDIAKNGNATTRSKMKALHL
jgi:hypothetical protein